MEAALAHSAEEEVPSVVSVVVVLEEEGPAGVGKKKSICRIPKVRKRQIDFFLPINIWYPIFPILQQISDVGSYFSKRTRYKI